MKRVNSVNRSELKVAGPVLIAAVVGIVLFARAGVTGSPESVQTGIQHYWRTFWSDQYTWGIILDSVAKCSYTINYMLGEGHRGLFLLFALIVVALLVLCIWLMAAGRRKEDLATVTEDDRPADRRRTTETGEE